MRQKEKRHKITYGVVTVLVVLRVDTITSTEAEPKVPEGVGGAGDVSSVVHHVADKGVTSLLLEEAQRVERLKSTVPERDRRHL
jgi:hypothetical protein